ncbi:MAG: hypothetical protein U9Q82_05500 [Chloroflexota bacterium]|nr:hypothetical protein [Chloroflexota bacterium]
MPGKKVLQPSDTPIEIVLVDASEQPIEHPKKAKMTLQRQKEGTCSKYCWFVQEQFTYPLVRMDFAILARSVYRPAGSAESTIAS